MSKQRFLVVMADDYGIGPPTSRAILELAEQGRVTTSVLLVNSPYAAEAVRAWRQAGQPLELGWHPCLTLDRPILPVRLVSSLVGPDGCFWPLGSFLRRWLLGRLQTAEIAAELHAQRERFIELVGSPPTVVNAHKHLQIFPPVGTILMDLLRTCQPLPYLRRVHEPWSMLASVPGARVKRIGLNWLGQRYARQQRAEGFPGNDALAGITDPRSVDDARYFARWLTLVPGQVVELACHPGYHDDTLIGRDCTAHDGLLQRRVRELHLLREASFLDACAAAGFRLVAPSALRNVPAAHLPRAA